jgi:hypothetical protein
MRSLDPSNLIFRGAMAVAGRASAMKLLKAARTPAEAQRRLLASILRAGEETAFGAEHQYGRIADPDAFRAAVPIRDYEGHRAWIDRQIAGEAAVTRETPLMYARTSGTTGEPKRLPITPTVLKGVRAAQQAASYFQNRACPMFRGRILALGGAKQEEVLPGGVPCGSVTGLIYETMPAVVRAKYVVPPEVFAIEDPDLKYAVVTRLALQHRDLTAVSTANPSTFLRLRDHARENWSTLMAELESGTFAAAGDLPEAQARGIRAALVPRPERARELRAAADIAEPTVEQLWPALAGVVTWTGGGCGLAADAVRQALAPRTRVIDAGYVASEFRGTVVVDVERSLGLPLLEDVFFEFVPAAEWDAGRRDTLLLHELEEGQDYQVIVTTPAGLARYWINDVVRAGPRIHGTPSLAFVRKGRGVTSITGEKVTESQVNLALQTVAAEAGLAIAFHLVLADEAAARYRVLLEAGEAPEAPALDRRIDAEIGATNIEYAAKRASGRLGPIEVRWLKPGAGAAYRRWCVSRGQRDAQFKAQTLQYARDCGFDFLPWLLGGGWR